MEQNNFNAVIKQYLDDLAEKNLFFKEKYNSDNINECCDYIIAEVKNSNRCGFADDEIYQLARHYYEENITLDKESTNGCKVVVNYTIELTEEEKENARKKAIQEYKDKIIEEERKKEQKEKEKIEKTLEKKMEKVKANGQQSLFDFME